MSEWRDYVFSDFALVNPTVSLLSNKIYSFVEMKDLDNGKRFCKPSQERLLSGGTRFQNFDTLFARITPCLENGKICQVKNLKEGKGFGSTEFHVFRERNLISDNNFIFYLSRWKEFRDFAEKNFNGTSGRERVPKEIFEKLYLKLPQLPEQRAIATVLGSLDDKIDLLHRQNRTLELLAETIFRQLFIEEAKEDWEVAKLGDVSDIGIGRTPPRKESEWFSTNPEDIKWISIKDLGDSGTFISNTNEFLTREAIDAFNIPVIPNKTVILSFKMTVGRIAITTEEMLSNEAIAHFIFNRLTPFTKEYLYLFLKLFNFDSLGSTSSIVTAINSAMIKELKITIPDDSTMTDFKEKSEPLFEKIKQNQTQIQKLKSVRDALLPKLMSGELRVKI